MGARPILDRNRIDKPWIWTGGAGWGDKARSQPVTSSAGPARNLKRPPHRIKVVPVAPMFVQIPALCVGITDFGGGCPPQASSRVCALGRPQPLRDDHLAMQSGDS